MAAIVSGLTSWCQGGAHRAAGCCLLLHLHELAQQRRNVICFGIAPR
jgi:hypothetical protein